MSGISVETEDDIVSFSTLEEIIQTHEDLCRQEEFGNKFFFATNISGDVFYFDTKLLSVGDDRVFSRALISEEADAIDVTEFIDSIIKMKPRNI